jgi:hypothetical protein
MGGILKVWFSEPSNKEFEGSSSPLSADDIGPNGQLYQYSTQADKRNNFILKFYVLSGVICGKRRIAGKGDFVTPNH